MFKNRILLVFSFIFIFFSCDNKKNILRYLENDKISDINQELLNKITQVEYQDILLTLIQNNDTQTLSYLLNIRPYELNFHVDNMSSIMIATEMSNLEMVNFLMLHGVDPYLEFKNLDAFDICINNKNSVIAEAILIKKVSFPHLYLYFITFGVVPTEILSVYFNNIEPFDLRSNNPSYSIFKEVLSLHFTFLYELLIDRDLFKAIDIKHLTKDLDEINIKFWVEYLLNKETVSNHTITELLESITDEEFIIKILEEISNNEIKEGWIEIPDGPGIIYEHRMRSENGSYYIYFDSSSFKSDIKYETSKDIHDLLLGDSIQNFKLDQIGRLGSIKNKKIANNSYLHFTGNDLFHGTLLHVDYLFREDYSEMYIGIDEDYASLFPMIEGYKDVVMVLKNKKDYYKDVIPGLESSFIGKISEIEFRPKAPRCGFLIWVTLDKKAKLETSKITSKDIILYEGYSPDTEILGNIPSGAKIIVTDWNYNGGKIWYEAINDLELFWYYVEFNDKKGWINSKEILQ